jgi:signal transduction histidine kinase
VKAERVLVAFVLTLLAYGLVFTAVNQVAIGSVRHNQVRALIAQLDASGELARCAEDPDAWRVRDRGLFGLRVAPTDVPLDGFGPADVPGALWSGAYRAPVAAPCNSFVVHQRTFMGLQLPAFLAHVLLRLVLGAAMTLTMWSLVIRPLFDEIERKERLLREVMADVAHDVQTPLTTLSLALERLRRVTSAPETDVALAQAAYLSALLRNVDMLVSLEGTALPVRHVPVDLRDVVRDVAERLSFAAAEEGRSLAFAVGDDPVVVAGDAHGLSRAVGNLVRNALQHAERHVALSVRRVGDTAVVRVVDDGTAPLARAPEALLERRVRGEGGGRGLGLAIARDVAEQHRGHLSLQRDDGVTEARLTLPTRA